MRSSLSLRALEQFSFFRKMWSDPNYARLTIWWMGSYAIYMIVYGFESSYFVEKIEEVAIDLYLPKLSSHSRQISLLRFVYSKDFLNYISNDFSFATPQAKGMSVSGGWNGTILGMALLAGSLSTILCSFPTTSTYIVHHLNKFVFGSFVIVIPAHFPFAL